MKLYSFFRSSAAYRLRIALNLKGLVAEKAFVNLRTNEQNSPGFLRLHPLGLVPNLEDNDRILTQSLAIIEYLDESYPEPRLLPISPVDRAFVRAVAFAVACDIHPINNLRVLNFLQHDIGISASEITRWYAHWIAVGFRGLEAMLSSDPRVGKFCFGDTPTLADICLVPQVANAERMKCRVDEYPTILRVTNNARELAAFQAAAPENQPDAE